MMFQCYLLEDFLKVMNLFFFLKFRIKLFGDFNNRYSNELIINNILKYNFKDSQRKKKLVKEKKFFLFGVWLKKE